MTIFSDLTEQMNDALSEPARLNEDLSPSRSAINAALIGLPRGEFKSEPAEPTVPEFRYLLETADLGPFTATGLAPAIRSLRAIVTDISLELPVLYERIGCAEMLACRYVKGSNCVVSSHSWGLAIDLTYEGHGKTDGQDDLMQAMKLVWPIFNRHGFYWGYAFGLQDATHFEASDQLVRAWSETGAFDTPPNLVLPRALNIGDRGPQVLALQVALNAKLRPLGIAEDGLFGPQTRMAIFALQRRAGLPPTGAAPKPVLAALDLA
ncbi:MAG: M15 family metallopeptidase [Pseudomonadota bacterium]